MHCISASSSLCPVHPSLPSSNLTTASLTLRMPSGFLWVTNRVRRHLKKKKKRSLIMSTEHNSQCHSLQPLSSRNTWLYNLARGYWWSFPLCTTKIPFMKGQEVWGYRAWTAESHNPHSYPSCATHQLRERAHYFTTVHLRYFISKLRVIEIVLW